MSESGQGEPNFKETDNVERERLGRFRGEHLRILNKCTWGICASLSLTCIIGMAIIILKVVFFKKTVLSMVKELPSDTVPKEGESERDMTLDNKGLRGNIPNLFAALEHNLTNDQSNLGTIDIWNNSLSVDVPDQSRDFEMMAVDEPRTKYSATEVGSLTTDVPGEILLINTNEIIGNEVPVFYDKRDAKNARLRERDPVHSRVEERDGITVEETNTEKSESKREPDGAMVNSPMDRRPVRDLNWSTSGLLRVGRRARRSVKKTANRRLSDGKRDEILRGG